MAAETSRVYVSMPRQFLADMDRVAHEEHLSRSALIRQAVRLYMSLRSESVTAPFFAMTQTLRERFSRLPTEELERRIDRAVAAAREPEAP